ncbi:MAG: hypothetical protein IH840_13490, partial [Candidatus Heimdallarchaeota archaeon]|nr:hypothetical protein [Candidatus Heimdallarchaeota archaeon]
LFTYAKALKSKAANRNESKALLKKIIDAPPTYFFEVTISAILSYCKMLVEDLKIDSGKTEFDEINSLVKRAEDYAQENNLHALYVSLSILRIKLSLINSEFEVAKDYFTIIEEFVEVNQLGYLQDQIEVQKSEYLELISKLKRSERAELSLHEKFHVTNFQQFIRAILEYSYEEIDSVRTYHIEGEYLTLCGVLINELRKSEEEFGLERFTVTKCSKCLSIHRHKTLRQIVVSHIQNTVCSNCQSQLNNLEALELVTTHEKMSGSIESPKDNFLGITTSLTNGTISWLCGSFKCGKEPKLEVNLSSIVGI